MDTGPRELTKDELRERLKEALGVLGYAAIAYGGTLAIPSCVIETNNPDDLVISWSNPVDGGGLIITCIPQPSRR